MFLFYNSGIQQKEILEIDRWSQHCSSKVHPVWPFWKFNLAFTVEVSLFFTQQVDHSTLLSHEITSLQEVETTTNEFAESRTSLEDIQNILDNEAETQASDETTTHEIETFGSTCASQDSESKCSDSTEISSDNNVHSQAYLGTEWRRFHLKLGLTAVKFQGLSGIDKCFSVTNRHRW